MVFPWRVRHLLWFDKQNEFANAPTIAVNTPPTMTTADTGTPALGPWILTC
jgi:hypothetical protein